MAVIIQVSSLFSNVQSHVQAAGMPVTAKWQSHLRWAHRDKYIRYYVTRVRWETGSSMNYLHCSCFVVLVHFKDRWYWNSNFLEINLLYVCVNTTASIEPKMHSCFTFNVEVGSILFDYVVPKFHWRNDQNTYTIILMTYWYTILETRWNVWWSLPTTVLQNSR